MIRDVLATIGCIGGLIAVIVIPGMHCALREAGQEIGELTDELEDTKKDLRLSRAVYLDQCALTTGILYYGYAYTTLEAIRENDHADNGPEPKWMTDMANTDFDTGAVNPNPPGSVIVYTGRGFNGCPEFKFVFPTAVKKGEVVVSPNGMRQMIKDWAAGKKVEMPGAIPERVAEEEK